MKINKKTEVTAAQTDSDLILIYPYFLKFSHRARK